MSYFLFPAKITSQELSSSSDFIISSGNPVRVWAITITQSGSVTSGGTTVTVSNGDDSSVIFETIRISRKVTHLDIPWIADEGLRFSTSFDDRIQITVMYSHEGS